MVCCACEHRRMIKSWPSGCNSPPSQCTFASAALSYELIDVPTNFCSLVHDFLPWSFTSRAFTRPCTQFDWNVYRALVYRALFRTHICESPCPCTCPSERHVLCVCVAQEYLSYVNDISVALISDTAFWCECLACTSRVYERLRGSPQNGTFIFSSTAYFHVIS